MLQLKLDTNISKKTNKEYVYFDVIIDGVQLIRLFPKSTEIPFYATHVGDYQKKITKE